MQWRERLWSKLLFAHFFCVRSCRMGGSSSKPPTQAELDGPHGDLLDAISKSGDKDDLANFLKALRTGSIASKNVRLFWPGKELNGMLIYAQTDKVVPGQGH
jgi:hypothetical protein